MLNTLAAVGALAVGGIIGGTLGKVVHDKRPDLDGVLVWASGALIGVGGTILATSRSISKSQAGAVLASNSTD